MKREPLVDPALPKIGDFILYSNSPLPFTGREITFAVRVLKNFKNGLYRTFDVVGDGWIFSSCGSSWDSQTRKISLK